MSRDRTLAIGGRDQPLFPIPDGLTGAGGEPTVIAAGDHDLTHVSAFAAGDGDGGGRVQVTVGEAGVLDGVVQCVDVLVAAGRDRHGPPGRGQGDPVPGDAGQVILEGAGVDAAVVLVGGEGVGVAGAQMQRGGGLPGVGEAVDADQFVGAAGGGQLGEESASSDRLELSGVAD